MAIAPCWVYLKEIADNGNLLFMVIFLFSLIGLAIYYPVLMVVGIVVRFRSAKKK